MSEVSIGDPQKIETKVSHEEKGFGISRIEKPEGIYEFHYGSHEKTQDITDFPEDATGIMLETGNLDYIETPVEEMIDMYENHTQYKDIMVMNKERLDPLYFTDASPRNAAVALVLLNSYMPALKAAGGSGALLGVTSDVLNHRNKVKSHHSHKEFFKDWPEHLMPSSAQSEVAPKLSRRDFLKMSGKAVVGTWLLTPLVTDLVNNALYNYEQRRERKTLDDISKELHPDEKILQAIFLTARNLVIAHKEQAIMEAKDDADAKLVSVLGADHFGIEETIQATPTERLESLKEMKPLLKVAFRDSTFYSYAELVPQQTENGTVLYERKITEIPELRELIED